ncbi:MAG: helix-turn-helix domain-containing protein [Nitrospirae bacterium]|nr:helix-turn-helix domain-containing protein [Nitrospirota bacterium]
MKLTQEKLAKQLGIAYPTLNKYENGHRIPDAELLSRISKILDCDPGWLLSGEDMNLENLPKPKNTPIFSTPVLSKIPAEFPKNATKEIASYICAQDIPDGAYSIIMKGESMSPALRDGDYVIFLPGEAVKDGDVTVVLNEWGETTLKRYRKKDDEVFLISDNPEYPVVTMQKSFRIIGKAIGALRRIRI